MTVGSQITRASKAMGWFQPDQCPLIYRQIPWKQQGGHSSGMVTLPRQGQRSAVYFSVLFWAYSNMQCFLKNVIHPQKGFPHSIPIFLLHHWLCLSNIAYIANHYFIIQKIGFAHNSAIIQWTVTVFSSISMFFLYTLFLNSNFNFSVLKKYKISPQHMCLDFCITKAISSGVTQCSSALDQPLHFHRFKWTQHNVSCLSKNKMDWNAWCDMPSTWGKPETCLPPSHVTWKHIMIQVSR